METQVERIADSDARRSFVGANTHIIVGDDEAALLGLWQQSHGEAEPEVTVGQPHLSTWPVE